MSYIDRLIELNIQIKRIQAQLDEYGEDPWRGPDWSRRAYRCLKMRQAERDTTVMLIDKGLIRADSGSAASLQVN